MKEYLRGFMQEFEYPKDARDHLLADYGKIVKSSADALSVLLAEYDISYDIDFNAALEKMKEISALAGVHEYTGALLLFLCYTRRLREYYAEAGIADEIFKNSMLDLKYKLQECRLVHGVYGSFVAYWFAGFFKLDRFALGRLQFEIVRFGGDLTTQGVTLTPDSKLINVHIPRTGERLDYGAVRESYRLASEFFSNRLGSVIAFVCSTWLFFPRHKTMLREGSNLLSFINDYDIFASGEYANYNEVWRLFDCIYDGDPDHLPADTSLRRSYVELIRNGERTGWGKGIYVYKSGIN